MKIFMKDKMNHLRNNQSEEQPIFRFQPGDSSAIKERISHICGNHFQINPLRSWESRSQLKFNRKKCSIDFSQNVQSTKKGKLVSDEKLFHDKFLYDFYLNLEGILKWIYNLSTENGKMGKWVLWIVWGLPMMPVGDQLAFQNPHKEMVENTF